MKEKVYLYKMDEETLLREESEIFELLPEWRKEKVQKIKPQGARLQSVAAGRLLDIAISKYLNIDISEVKWDFRAQYFDHEQKENAVINYYAFSDNKNSKKNSSQNLNKNLDNDAVNIIYYNISHAGNYVAVAISETSVGIDVENKEDKDFKVTRRFFAPKEVECITGDLGDLFKNQCRFRDVWTMKEAFLKCVGTGINTSLGGFEGDIRKDYEDGSGTSEGVIVSVKSGDRNGYDLQGKEYHFVTARLDTGEYSLTICSENPKLTLDIERVEVLL